jgi:tetratricopeptide (TPR) repeat protein
MASNSQNAALASGLTGGAATASGVDYQTQYAIFVCLKLMARILRESPTDTPVLTIEPRILSEDQPKVVARWDVRFTSGNQTVATECKSNLTKNDVEEFLKRCLDTPNVKCELVYSEGDAKAVRPLNDLIRLSTESSGEFERFLALCTAEKSRDLQKILSILGPQAIKVAQRIQVCHNPESVLRDNITLCLQSLVQPQHQQELYNHLFTSFVTAMKRRASFPINILLRQLRKERIVFNTPQTVTPTEINDELYRTLFILQDCPTGLPLDLASILTSTDPERLEEEFNRTQSAIRTATGEWKINDLSTRLDHPKSQTLITSATRELLSFIKANRSSTTGKRQIDNALSLLKICEQQKLEIAVKGFSVLEKILKTRGDKKAVLALANLTVAIASASASEDARQAEAQVKICGLAWVYQRIGEFEKAEQAAAESLSIGEDLEWKRNTAFCYKCVGRLRRIRAEFEHNIRTRKKLLNESKEKLEMAIHEFSLLDDFGPSSQEVGDCYSLLGRTNLVLGRLEVADQNAEQSREILSAFPEHETSKDYIDLLILEGELLSHRLKHSEAIKKFDQVLTSLDLQNAESCEIAARAHLTKGRVLVKIGNVKEGCEELTRARDIYHSLDEDYNRDTAAWDLHEANGEIPKGARNRMMQEKPSVRVEMLRLYANLSKPSSTNTIAQRAELNDKVWENLTKEAKKNVTSRRRLW